MGAKTLWTRWRLLHWSAFFFGSVDLIQSSCYQDWTSFCSVPWACNLGFVRVAYQTRGHDTWHVRRGTKFICCSVKWGNDRQSAKVPYKLYFSFHAVFLEVHSDSYRKKMRSLKSFWSIIPLIYNSIERLPKIKKRNSSVDGWTIGTFLSSENSCSGLTN